MKLGLSVMAITLLGLGVAAADSVDFANTRVEFSVQAVYDTVLELHKDLPGNTGIKVAYNILTSVLGADLEKERTTTFKELCDAYVAAATKQGVSPVACSDFVEKTIQKHNTIIDNIVGNEQLATISANNRSVRVAWHPDALNVACWSLAEFNIIPSRNCGSYAKSVGTIPPVSIDEIKDDCVKKISDENACERFVQRSVLLHNYYVKRRNNNITSTVPVPPLSTADNNFVVRPYNYFEETQKLNGPFRFCQMPYTTTSEQNAVIYDVSDSSIEPQPIGLMYINYSDGNYYGDTRLTGCLRKPYYSEHAFFIECHDGFSDCNILHTK